MQMRPFKTPSIVGKPLLTPARVPSPASASTTTLVSDPNADAEASSSSTGVAAVGAASFYAKPKPPAKKIVVGEKSRREREAWGGALHDPFAPDAVVLPRPSETEAKRRGTGINDVVVDPLLAAKMRDHQKKGVEVSTREGGRREEGRRLTAVHVSLRHGHDGHQWAGVHPRGRNGSRKDAPDNCADLHAVQWVDT